MSVRLRILLLLLLVLAATLALPAGPASAGWNDGHKRCTPHSDC
jgi:hypothetical protein